MVTVSDLKVLAVIARRAVDAAATARVPRMPSYSIRRVLLAVRSIAVSIEAGV